MNKRQLLTLSLLVWLFGASLFAQSQRKSEVVNAKTYYDTQTEMFVEGAKIYYKVFVLQTLPAEEVTTIEGMQLGYFEGFAESYEEVFNLILMKETGSAPIASSKNALSKYVVNTIHEYPIPIMYCRALYGQKWPDEFRIYWTKISKNS